jgi:ABC-2 type transport system permease protein
VSQPGTLVWFARHEARLTWRDAMSMMTAGRRDREKLVVVFVVSFAGLMHVVAYMVLGRVGKTGLHPDLATLITVTAGLLLSGSAMLSQAMESVTRTFYTRSDLELILTSPAPAHRLFAVRIAAIGLSVSMMSLLFVGPFIDVLAWRAGPRWLSAYGVVAAVSLIATSVAIVLTASLFQTIGPKRTRLVAQIVAAVIGGLFVIGLQLAAMFSTGTLSRLAFLRSPYVLAHAPKLTSVLWWPARASLGEMYALCAVMLASVAAFLTITWVYAPRFATYVVSASSITSERTRPRNSPKRFVVRPAAAALRRKEWLLLLRDPWLMSQSLMQLLYLLPPTVLMWRSFTLGSSAAAIFVPVLIMAAGQLAGGLAWLTISGEDAPDLVLTAPVSHSRLLLAKIEAVIGCIAIVFAPFVLGLLIYAPALALITMAGVASSAASAALIQLWFRSQAKRNSFRRRHTSSRIATFSEAFSSIMWAATGAVAAAGSWLAAIVALLAVGLLAFVRLLSPARTLRSAR